MKIFVPRDAAARAVGADKVAAAIVDEARRQGVAIEMPSQPRAPTYGGTKYSPRSVATLSSCAPSGAAHHRCGKSCS